MHQLVRWRFEAFLAALAAIEIATVAAADVPHKAAALVITALSVGVLTGVRWQPLTAVTAAFALLTVSVAVMPHSTTAQFFGTMATFAIAGGFESVVEAGLGWLAGAAMLGYAAWVDPLGGGASDFALSLAFGTTMWGAGLLVAGHRRRLAQTIELAARAEADRVEQTRRALADERAAIARELHDVVSHGLSVVIVQTVAARSRLSDLHDLAGGDVDRHLDAVEASARDALGEMRRMLGLLQNEHDEPDAPAPAPGLRHLDDLIDRVAPDGSRIHASVDDDLALAPGMELALFRIVQEALTNVVKHAPGAAVDVTVHRAGTEVVVAVTNTATGHPATDPPPGAGRGLIGVRQRADLYGGTMSAGPTTDGGYQLTVRLPIHQDSDPVAVTYPASAAS